MRTETDGGFVGRREYAYGRLTARLADSASPNGEWLARLIATWQCGGGALPDALGLEPAAFAALCEAFFPGAELAPAAASGHEVDFTRMLERDDLRRFLVDQAAFPDRPETEWIIDIVIAACMGSDHLWQDLGLWSRADLSDLIHYNFPALKTMNSRDMKWKKFLYKQLCEAEGIYTCRAPSCEVCTDYNHCFGPED